MIMNESAANTGGFSVEILNNVVPESYFGKASDDNQPETWLTKAFLI
jgi:hypothetical protein